MQWQNPGTGQQPMSESQSQILRARLNQRAAFQQQQQQLQQQQQQQQQQQVCKIFILQSIANTMSQLSSFAQPQSKCLPT
jgi:hypothetical protein